MENKRRTLETIALLGSAVLGIAGSLKLSDVVFDSYQREFCEQYSWLKDQPTEVIEQEAVKYADEHVHWYNNYATAKNDWYKSFKISLDACE